MNGLERGRPPVSQLEQTAEPRPLQGEIRLMRPDERQTTKAALAEAGFLVVALDEREPVARGTLGDAIDDAIEQELGARGIPTPGLPGASSFSSYRDAALSDQLFRARCSGASGLAVVLGSLRVAAAPLGALDPQDADTLAFLAQATRERPLLLVLDAADATLPAYAKPGPLSDVLFPPARPAVQPIVSAPAFAPLPPSAPTPPDPAWRLHVLNLTEARGPQPLAVLERLFAESYVPLDALIHAGLDDPRAREARDQFAAAFSKSYGDAFSTFAATNKRPRMVFDAYDVAARLARLHGARTVRLLLVDAMRWDVAQEVRHSLATRLAGATLAEHLVLWSALPTTTARQLETIARGVEALRAPASLEPEAEPPRSRNAEHIRRMRVGPREVHKLDLVESRVRGARGNVLRELSPIAAGAAEAIARHVQALPAGTLLLAFGDHGFSIDKKGFATQGGSTPEEVLVGAFALLVGNVH